MGIIVPILTFVFLLLTRVSHADSKPRVILVGGSAASWKVPDSHDKTLNHWAETNRFKVGDILGTLLFLHLFIFLMMHKTAVLMFLLMFLSQSKLIVEN